MQPALQTSSGLFDDVPNNVKSRVKICAQIDVAVGCATLVRSIELSELSELSERAAAGNVRA